MPDVTNSNPTWLPILTFFLGFLGKVGSDILQNYFVSRHDREARSAEQKAQIRERRINFQHQTLLDLQDAIMQLARSTGAIYIHDQRAYRDTGKWAQQLVPEELSEGARLSQVRVSILSERVRDDDIRELCIVLRESCMKVTTSRSLADAQLEMSSMADKLTQLQEQIGKILRGLDDDLEASIR